MDRRYREGVLARIAGDMQASSARLVVLIGRASRIGDLLYNRRLAARRALAVRDALMEHEVAPERIQTMWFGWEPPQIDEWVASQYQFSELFHRVGIRGMNQSVIAVVYSAEEELASVEEEFVAASELESAVPTQELPAVSSPPPAMAEAAAEAEDGVTPSAPAQEPQEGVHSQGVDETSEIREQALWLNTPSEEPSEGEWRWSEGEAESGPPSDGRGSSPD